MKELTHAMKIDWRRFFLYGSNY